MAHLGCSAHGEPDHNASGTMATPEACLRNARSWFSGSPIDFELACTVTDDEACQIVRHLPLWNEFLYFLNYELRESSGTSGHLSLVDIDYPRLSRPRETDYDTWLQVNFLMNKLLATHRCIGTLDLKCSFSSRILHPYEYFFCDALRTNPSIKTLKMNFLDDHEHENVCAAISTCVKLERLELDHSLRPPEGLFPALSSLLRTTTALTVLKMPQLQITKQQADSLLTALRENTTLKELLISESPSSKVSLVNRPGFAQYLKNTATLKTLSVGVAVVTRGLHAERDTRGVDAVISHLAREAVGSVFRSCGTEAKPEESDCGRNRENRRLLPQLRSFLGESGAQAKTALDTGCYFLGSEPDLPHYGAFSRVCAFRGQYTTRELFQTLEHATSLDHITHLFLQIKVVDFDKSLSSAISKYVKVTSTLQELRLSTNWSPLPNNHPNRSWNIIVSSFFENKSIKQLSVSATYMDDEDVERLADAVKLSKVIRGADYLNEEPKKSRLFFRHLSADIADNYRILRVNFFTPTERDSLAFRDWYAVWEVARRNSDLIRRAAAFVSSARSDRCCASALERVASHPALREEVAKLCSVDEAEAARMIRAALLSFQSIEAFMRLAGVVRQRVECHPREDGRLQLHDLNEYCWAALRRYLTLSDVRESPARP
ncbi:uncharacterized protein LOC144123801 [Amblyomma americanum]